MNHKLIIVSSLIIMMLCLVKPIAAQPFEVVLKESTFTKSIRWYVDQTQEFLKGISKGNNKVRLNGIVLIELREIQDSVFRVRRDTTQVYDMFNNRKSEFKIMMVSPTLVQQPPPLLYCIYEGVPIVIYAGVESITIPQKRMVREFKRAILDKTQDFVVVPGIETFVITIEDPLSGDFKTKKIGQ